MILLGRDKWRKEKFESVKFAEPCLAGDGVLRSPIPASCSQGSHHCHRFMSPRLDLDTVIIRPYGTTEG